MTNLHTAAMKLALEALEYIDLCDNDRDFLHPHECFQLDEAITAIKQALNDATHLAAPYVASQLVQEPVSVILSQWKSGAIGATEAILELFKHYPSNPSISATQQTAQQAVPEGYALIGIDALKAWGKYDLVKSMCMFPADQPAAQPAPVQEPEKFDPNDSFERDEAARNRVREFMRNH